MKTKKLYVIGDSTVASFNDPYYYPRYGYGTQLENYFQGISVVNLALSGRSSKSFIEEENYKILWNSIQPGDYLMIGFGHNDEKNDDPLRFTDASKPMSDPSSFAYHLLQFYIEPALKKQVSVILCTPICRVDSNNDYTKNNAHITINGDYREAICHLGEEKNIPVLDLTSETKKVYTEIGFLETVKYYATIAGKYDETGAVIPDLTTVDPTHLNIYGAKFIAYLIANLVQQSSHPLSQYLPKNIVPPTENQDLVANPLYKVAVYKTPDLKQYQPKAHFSVKTEGWYGTAFGDCGGIPDDAATGFVAEEKESGLFLVGQYGPSVKGKISLVSDGLAFCFRQIAVKENFELKATARIIQTADVKQAGFGLMLRDDCYINQSANTTIVTSNYLAAGIVTTDVTMNPIFYRESVELHKEEPILPFLYQAGEEIQLAIRRVGQSMQMEVLYAGKKYEKTYVDFDLLTIDHTYMYVGMFATRGTVVEFSNVEFHYTGTSQGA